MTYPKIRPCPNCGGSALSVYKYDSGWQYVECDSPLPSGGACWYSGPGEGSIMQAIRSHNARVEALAEAEGK